MTVEEMQRHLAAPDAGVHSAITLWVALVGALVAHRRVMVRG